MALQDSTMLITGASQGLGRAMAGHFATKCRHIIVSARNEDGLMRTVSDVREQGGSCEYVCMDLALPEDIEQAAATLRDRADTLDVLIHNAADVTSKPFVDTTLSEMDRQIRTNVTGPLLLTRALLELFNGDGMKTVAFVSSLAGYKPNPAQTVYSVSKAATNGMALALRADLGKQGFHILNAPLSSVDFDGSGRAGSIAAARVCALIEAAIVDKRNEVFLSAASRALMRLYGMFPGLMRL